MSGLFTRHAIESMGERSLSASDRMRLLEKVEEVASNPSELARSGDVMRVGRPRGEIAFILRAGDMRAVLAFDPDNPEQVVVISVFRDDGTDRSGPSFDRAWTRGEPERLL